MSKYDGVIMPFGKHKGLKIADVPLGYCQWVLENCDLKGYLLGAIEERLGLPESGGGRPWQAVAGAGGREEKFSVSRWFNKLAAEFHPDTNDGDCRPMQIVERAREVLLEQLTNKR